MSRETAETRKEWVEVERKGWEEVYLASRKRGPS